MNMLKKKEAGWLFPRPGLESVVSFFVSKRLLSYNTGGKAFW